MRPPRRSLAALTALAGLSCAGAGARSAAERPPCDDQASCTAVLREAIAKSAVDDDDSRPDFARAQEAADLVGAFGPGACEIITRLLESRSKGMRWLGARAIAHATEADRACAAPALVDALRAPRPAELVTSALEVHDPRVVAALVDDLPGDDDRLSYLHFATLKSLGPAAAATLPRLARIAASHWDWPTRVEAARAYTAIAGTPIAPGPYPCPAAVRRIKVETAARDRWIVDLASGRAEFALPPDTRGPSSPACDRAGADRSAAWMALGDECLTANYGAHCRATIDVWRDGRRTMIADAGAFHFLRRDHDVLGIDTCSTDMFTMDWGITSLTRSAGGAWTGRTVADRGGEGLAGYAMDGAGGVDLLVFAPVIPANEAPKNRDDVCHGRTVVEGVDGVTDGGFAVLYIDAAGRIAPRN